MADTKISSLTELTSLAPTDELVVVDKSDTAMAGSGTDKRIKWSTIQATGAERLERYVDYVNGDDANLGLTPASAMKTIQAAYNALRTYTEANYTPAGSWLGVGRIYLAPGDHNVGMGVVIEGWRPVEIYGTHSGYLNHTQANSASRILSTSSSAAEFIKVAHTSPSDGISRGFRIRDVAFQPDTAVNTSLTKCIYLRSTIEAEVSWCSFDVADGTTTSTITCIYQEALAGAGDNMGLRLNNNFSSRLQFYKCPAGGNFNRIVIDKNRIGYEHATTPSIHLEGDFRGSLIGPNQLQGAATHIKADSGNADGNVFIQNAGESTNSVINPFIDIAGSISNCVVIGGDVTTGASVSRTVTAATNASPIVVTTSAAHGFTTGDIVTLTGVLGNTAANGTWTVIVTSTTQFSLTSSTGNGTWSAGGTQVAYPHGVYLRFGVNAKSNVYIGGASATGVAQSALKDRIVDNSTTGGNRIVSGDYGAVLKIASGATVEDADFRSVPPNGSLAMAADGAIWRRVDNAWAAVAGAGASVATDAIFDAKGDLPVGTGANTAAKRDVGGDDTLLIADSATATGLKYAQLINANVDTAAAIAESKLALASDAAAGTASRRTLGTSATSAAAGNDPRLSLNPFPAPTGALAETYPRLMPNPTFVVVVNSGVLRLGAIVLTTGITVTSVSWLIGSTALVLGTSPHAWFALYDSSLNLLRQSSDDTAATMGASAVKTYNLASTHLTTYSGLHYIGLMVAQTGGTMPTLAGVSASNLGQALLPPLLAGDSTTTLGATAPNPAGALSIKNVCYGYVS